MEFPTQKVEETLPTLICPQIQDGSSANKQ